MDERIFEGNDGTTGIDWLVMMMMMMMMNDKGDNEK